MANQGLEWQPLVTGDRAGVARAEIERLADSVVVMSTSSGAPPSKLSLGAGHAGLILFLAHAGDHLGVERFRAAAVDLADQLKSSLGTAPWTTGLLSGLCGVGWLFEYLDRTGKLPQPRPLLDTIERSVRRAVMSSPPRSASNLTAVLIYFLERHGRQGFEAALSASPGDSSARWWSRGDDRLSLGSREAAILHSMVRGGLVGDLLRGVTREAAEVVRTSCREWDTALEESSKRLTTTHLSWFAGCLGPPTIVSSTMCGDAEDALDQNLFALSRHAAGLDPDVVRLLDLGLSHGASGIALMFARLAQRSRDSSLRHAARAWYLGTLDAVARTRFVHHDLSFATGAAGIGLSLLAAITPSPPSWDRVLGLSTRNGDPAAAPRA